MKNETKFETGEWYMMKPSAQAIYGAAMLRLVEAGDSMGVFETKKGTRLVVPFTCMVP